MFNIRNKPGASTRATALAYPVAAGVVLSRPPLWPDQAMTALIQDGLIAGIGPSLPCGMV